MKCKRCNKEVGDSIIHTCNVRKRMTVRDLITRLMEYDLDDDVWLWDETIEDWANDIHLEYMEGDYPGVHFYIVEGE